MTNVKDATRIVRAGAPPKSQGAPFMQGPAFASVFHLSGDPGSSPYQYGRYDNPTWVRFETALEELEGGPAIVFASGMAAVFAALGTALANGDVLGVTQDAYYATRTVGARHLAARGVGIRMLGATGDPAGELDGIAMLWIETPSNPSLNTYDIARLAEAAHERNILVAVDNTTPTVGGQKPLALGADFSVASDTKALTGHSDVVLGHVAVRDAERAAKLRAWRTETGSIPGPMEVWLAHRSLGTLDVRLERMCANAMGVARYLDGRGDLLQVRYPGLPNDPSHEVASRQMARFGPVVGFELPTAAAAASFFASSRLVIEATSFGSLHTTGERRARWGGDAIGEGFIRLSLGCEHVDDLCDDLGRAIDRALGT
jgi:cystathionine gamma-lyase